MHIECINASPDSFIMFGHFWNLLLRLYTGYHPVRYVNCILGRLIILKRPCHNTKRDHRATSYDKQLPLQEDEKENKEKEEVKAHTEKEEEGNEEEKREEEEKEEKKMKKMKDTSYRNDVEGQTV